MSTITIVGTGNVAWHLFQAFSQHDEISILQVVGRNKEGLKSFGKAATLLQNTLDIAKADVYIIAVSDDAILEVSELFLGLEGLVVHTSGSVPMQVLAKHSDYGVFYPLQTFSKGRSLNFKTIPICIEANSEKNDVFLSRLARSISDVQHRINSVQRRSLHLAAVFANNFTNHLYHIAHSVCTDHEVPFSILNPLILETAAKVSQGAPYQMQTGPAKRGDHQTQQRHLALLEVQAQKDIYTLLSSAITKTYQNK